MTYLQCKTYILLYSFIGPDINHRGFAVADIVALEAFSNQKYNIKRKIRIMT